LSGGLCGAVQAQRQRQAIARLIESGPIPAVHGVVRWRLIDWQWIFEESPVSIASSWELRAIASSPLGHAVMPELEDAVEDFKDAAENEGAVYF
jgi:hypothetical protein